MIVYSALNYHGVCFKSIEDGNIYVSDTGAGVGSYSWERFLDATEHYAVDFKWAKLHGYVDVLKQSKFAHLVDWEYYGIKK